MVADCAHILVVDDDLRLRSLLQRYLQESGFAVSAAEDAECARKFLRIYKFDLLVVDVMMPKESGVEFLHKLRKESSVPAIILTAMGEAADRIVGLEAGADDYLAKPFEPKELILRINNILRRLPKIEMSDNNILKFGNCFYDMVQQKLKNASGVIHITPAEQSILSVLGKKVGQIFARDQLSDILGLEQNPRSVDVQITRLRKKIEKDSKNPRYLQTVRGKGYMLLTDEEK